MADIQEVKHITVNGKYRITIEKAAGTKSGDGFKVEANDDDIDKVQQEAMAMYNAMKQFVSMSVPPVS
jgi:hypothetical protein